MKEVNHKWEKVKVKSDEKKRGEKNKEEVKKKQEKKREEKKRLRRVIEWYGEVRLLIGHCNIGQ